MARPKVIQELSRFLEVRIGESVRSEVPGETAFPLFLLQHPQDLDRAAELPAAGLYLWDVVTESCYRTPGQSLESFGGGTVPTTGQEYLRDAPLWITCRYVVVSRGRRADEEQEILAAVIQCLHDLRVVPLEALPSLKGESALTELGDRYPIRIHSTSDLWRLLGLNRHQLLVACEVTVPLPSLRRQPVARILDRQIRIEDRNSTATSSLFFEERDPK